MQKIKYGEKVFPVKGINANDYKGIDTIEITFDEGVTFADVQSFYDTNRKADTLRRMEVYSVATEVQPVENPVEGEPTEKAVEVEILQGVHIGYTKPCDISCFNGVIKVKIEKELAVESQVATLRSDLDNTIMAQLEKEGIL